MRDRRMLIVWSVLVGFIAIGAVWFLFLRGGAEQAEPPITPGTATPQPLAEDQTGTTDTADLPQPATAARITVTSRRDPFAPVVTPTPAAEQDSGGTDKATSSSNPATQPKTTKSTNIVKKPDTAGSQSGDATKTEKSSDKDSGSKAPVPIGGKVVKKEGESTGITVIQVRESVAVARINDVRTTLYLSVPDASGVTFVSSLGGGCGWFATSGAEDRLTICEGDTRQL